MVGLQWPGCGQHLCARDDGGRDAGDWFSGPMSFLLAATLVVTLTALQASFERSHHGIVVSAGTSLFLGLPILLAPAAVDAHVKSLLETLFP